MGGGGVGGRGEEEVVVKVEVIVVDRGMHMTACSRAHALNRGTDADTDTSARAHTHTHTPSAHGRACRARSHKHTRRTLSWPAAQTPLHHGESRLGRCCGPGPGLRLSQRARRGTPDTHDRRPAAPFLTVRLESAPCSSPKFDCFPPPPPPLPEYSPSDGANTLGA
jgi:hypothetical protein